MSDNILLTQEEIDNLPCRLWDVYGSNNYTENNSTTRFIEKLKSKLEETKLPIKIGWTGYPELTCSPSDCPKKGWFFDKAKRFNAIINGYYMFQRYTTGGHIMYGRLEGPANNILLPENYDLFYDML